MPFRLTELRVAHFPNDATTTRVLSDFGLPESAIQEALNEFVCHAAPHSGRGYQQFVARDLEQHLLGRLVRSPALRPGIARYSPRLNEKADLAIAREGSERRVFFEVEFRPNVEKDLVKFQIGANSGALAAAILILATDRNTINRGYTTMPEFQKFERVITELAPPYPLVLYGITGRHEPASP